MNRTELVKAYDVLPGQVIRIYEFDESLKLRHHDTQVLKVLRITPEIRVIGLMESFLARPDYCSPPKAVENYYSMTTLYLERKSATMFVRDDCFVEVVGSPLRVA